MFASVQPSAATVHRTVALNIFKSGAERKKKTETQRSRLLCCSPVAVTRRMSSARTPSSLADRSHSLPSLSPPPAAVGSLPHGRHDRLCRCRSRRGYQGLIPNIEMASAVAEAIFYAIRCTTAWFIKSFLNMFHFLPFRLTSRFLECMLCVVFTENASSTSIYKGGELL